MKLLSVIAEPSDLHNKLCEIGPVIMFGDFKTDVLNNHSSLKS